MSRAGPDPDGRVLFWERADTRRIRRISVTPSFLVPDRRYLRFSTRSADAGDRRAAPSAVGALRCTVRWSHSAPGGPANRQRSGCSSSSTRWRRRFPTDCATSSSMRCRGGTRSRRSRPRRRTTRPRSGAGSRPRLRHRRRLRWRRDAERGRQRTGRDGCACLGAAGRSTNVVCRRWGCQTTWSMRPTPADPGR